MFKTTLIGMIIAASASIAAAQNDYKKFEFFGGYSNNRVDTGVDDADPSLRSIIDDRQGYHGFNTSFTGNLSRYFGLKVDFSAHYNSETFSLGTTPIATTDSRLYNFMGGVQVKDNSPESTFKPFAHALAGVGHIRNRVNVTSDVCATVFPNPCPVIFRDSDSGFAGAFGGGIDIRVSNRVDLRAIQLDYNPVRVGDSTLHNVRIGVGIVFH